MLDPQNRFLGAPGIHPEGGRRAQFFDIPPGPRLPPPPVEPPVQAVTLTLTEAGRVTLAKALLQAAGLKAGSRLHLVEPRLRGGAWYLDTNPKPGMGTSLPKNPRARAEVTIPKPSATHFLRTTPTPRQGGRGFTANTNHIDRASRLAFALGEEVDGHPGYYRLIAV